MTIALLLHTLLHGRPPSKYDVMVYQMAFMGGAIDPGMMAGMGRRNGKRNWHASGMPEKRR